LLSVNIDMSIGTIIVAVCIEHIEQIVGWLLFHKDGIPATHGCGGINPGLKRDLVGEVKAV